ncbi:MAG: hypothetical protein DRN14_00235 [Thermoplasmata archaeon]|nr:MAG: hypothetical protein DRN14_00235 [Thermoplasmata archaeon]
MPYDVWAIWPSAHPKLANETAKRWKAAGYKTAVLLDNVGDRPSECNAVCVAREWKGFPNAINVLTRMVKADMVVCIGDDLFPAREADCQTIARQFAERFPDLFGVMQPTGDRFGSIDECAPSPWIGRGFIDEAYGGNGPYYDQYFHYFCDAELQEVAVLLDAFQQRRDLSQYHDHWQRDGGERPPHLMRALKEWKKDRALYEGRKRHNFPGHERKRG